MIKRTRPSCCISLQTQVIILSVIDLVGGLTLVVLIIQAFYPALNYIWEVEEISLELIVAFIFAVGTILSQVFLALVLIHGTWNNKKLLCRIWLLASALLFILKGITAIVHLATENHDHDGISYGLLIDTVYKLYQAPIVILFMKRELQEKGGQVLLFNQSELEPV